MITVIKPITIIVNPTEMINKSNHTIVIFDYAGNVVEIPINRLVATGGSNGRERVKHISPIQSALYLAQRAWNENHDDRDDD